MSLYVSLDDAKNLNPEVKNGQISKEKTMGRKRKDIQMYKDNPFHAVTTYKTRNKRVAVAAGKHILLDRETGQYQHPTEIVAVHEVDAEQFVKIYTGQIRSLFELGPAAFRLMEVVFIKVQEEAMNGDKIYLNSQMATDYFEKMDRQPMSRQTFDRALNELLSKNILAQSTWPAMYFINHNIFFNGDRFRFITEYRKKKPTKHEQLEKQGQHRLFDETTPEEA